MNTRTTFIVLLLALGLSGYFLLVELDMLSLHSDKTEQATPASGIALIGEGRIPAAAVRSIELSATDEGQMVIDRTDTGWMQSAPVRFAMDRYAVERLIDTALQLSYTQKFDADDSIKAGADLAVVKLSGEYFELAGRRFATREAAEAQAKAKSDVRTVPFSFSIGVKRTSAAGRAYATLDGKPTIYVVSDALNRMLTAGDALDQMRQKMLPGVEPTDVAQVELVNSRTHVAFTPVDSGVSWQFAAGAEGRVKASAVEALIASARAFVETFVAQSPDDLSRFGLDKPLIRLSLTDKKGTVHTLAIGRATDLTLKSCFAMWNDQPLIFTLPMSIMDKLGGSLESFRDDRLTPVDRVDVVGITLDPPGSSGLPIKLLRSEGKWTFAQPQWTYDVEPEAINELLNAIFGTRAESFRDLPGKAEVLGKVEIELRDAKEIEVLTLLQAGEKFMVSRKGESIVAVVNRAALSAAMQGPTFFRERTVLDLPADKITAIEVQHTGPYRATHTINRDEKGQINFDAMDRQAVEALIASLAPLRAARWLDPAEQFSPDVTIQLTTPDGQRTIALNSQTKQARLDDEAFEITLPALDALTAELAKRTLIDWPIDQLASVQIGDATIDRDQAGNFKITPTDALTEEQAGKICDTLIGLGALRFVDASAVKVDATQPSSTIRLTHRDGRAVVLSLWSPSENDLNSYLGRLEDGRWFTIETRSAGALLNP